MKWQDYSKRVFGKAVKSRSSDTSGRQFPMLPPHRLTGVYISYDTMLERCEVSMQGGGCELFISQYHPYTGTYMTYVLESNLSDRRLLLAKLEEILADRRNPYLWSHNLYKRNSFGIERRYDTGHSSMWGGRIAVPRQSKFFGR